MGAASRPRWPSRAPGPPPARRARSAPTRAAAPSPRPALAGGARLVNDVGGGADPALLGAAAAARAGLVLGHARGSPADMLRAPHAEYPAAAGGVAGAVARELGASVRQAMAAGVRRWRLGVDPGVGFAKPPRQSVEALRGLAGLREEHGLCGLPLVVGVSRKSVLRRLVLEPGRTVDGDADGRRRLLAASVAGTAAAVQMGADVVRVHDVLENVAAARVADALYRGAAVGD